MRKKKKSKLYMQAFILLIPCLVWNSPIKSLPNRADYSNETYCAPDQDSVFRMLLKKFEWGDPSPNYSIDVEKQISNSPGTIQVVSLSSIEYFPPGLIPYFIVWRTISKVCFTNLTASETAKYDGYYDIAITDLNESAQLGTYQITIDSSLNYTAPDHNWIGAECTRSITYFRIDSTKGPQILAYQIPVLDSGSGIKKNKKWSSLKVNINNDGLVAIKKGFGNLTKKQLRWIGTFQLGNSNSISDLPSITKSISTLHAKATALFKSGDPNGAADTLAQAISFNSVLSPSTIPIANDLGFFLVEAKRYLEGIKALEIVLAADSNRTVAYLNLGDAYAGAGKTGEARQNYRKYCDRMEKAGKGAKIPPRIKVALEK